MVFGVQFEQQFEQCRRHFEVVDQKMVDGRRPNQFEGRARIAVVPFEIHLLVLRHQLGKTLKGLKPLVAGFLDISGTLHFAGTGQYFGKIIGSLADYLVGLVGSRVKAGILHRAAF